MLMRHSLRTDENQKEIVRALRKIGCTVYVIGLPVDLLVGFRGRNFLMEVKVDSKKKLTKLQQKFFGEWRGEVARVESVEQALEVVSNGWENKGRQ